VTIAKFNDHQLINLNQHQEFSAATLTARALEDKKAKSISILNLVNKAVFADAFVVASATSRTHAQGLAKAAMDQLHKLGLTATLQGEQDSDWLVVDGGDIVVHLFCNDARDLYNLEKLWSDDAGWDDDGTVYSTPAPEKIAS